jgi:hypothetical protein
MEFVTMVLVAQNVGLEILLLLVKNNLKNVKIIATP